MIMRFLSKKKCMKGGCTPIRRKKTNPKSQKKTTNNTNNTSAASNAESTANIIEHPDIGKPIQLPLILPKEVRLKTYGLNKLDDLTPEQKLNQFDELRKANPGTGSKYLLPKFYNYLMTQYENIRYLKLEKEKNKKEREELRKTGLTIPQTISNNLNFPVQEPIDPKILEKIRQNSNQYARRKMIELHNYNMNNVNNTKKNNNLNTETIALRKERMKYLLNLRKNPIIHKEETVEEREKRLKELGYPKHKQKKNQSYEIPVPVSESKYEIPVPVSDSIYEIPVPVSDPNYEIPFPVSDPNYENYYSYIYNNINRSPSRRNSRFKKKLSIKVKGNANSNI